MPLYIIHCFNMLILSILHHSSSSNLPSLYPYEFLQPVHPNRTQSEYNTPFLLPCSQSSAEMPNKIITLLGAGIGLAAEAASHRREKSSQSCGQVSLDAREPISRQQLGAQRSSYSDEPPSYDEANAGSPIASRSYQDLRVLQEKPRTSEKRSFDGASYNENNSFGESPPTPYSVPVTQIPSTNFRTPLPLPVIIPQRRPEKKSRGFAIAYAPSLENCGIDQQMFLDFILKFNKACETSPVLDVVNLAAFGVGFAPGIAPMIVSTVVPIAVQAAKHYQTKVQSSNYIKKANDEIFEPRGLFAMMTVIKPGQKSQIISMNIQSSSADTSSGDQFEFPPSAPLVFFNERELLVASEKPRNSYQRGSAFVSDYVDRRVQARYANEHLGDHLRPDPKFRSGWADPNHPAYSGGLITLVSGGLIQKGRNGGNNRGRREADGESADDDDRSSRSSNKGRNTDNRNRNQGPIGTVLGAIAGEKGQQIQQRGLIGGVKSMALGPQHANKGLISGLRDRAMQENLIYLMIVNKPADDPDTPGTIYPEQAHTAGPSSSNPLYSNPVLPP